MFIPLHDANVLKSIRLQYVTMLLIAANVLVWLIMAIPELDGTAVTGSLYHSWGFVPATVNDVSELPTELVVIPDTVSYITYAFIHAGFLHLVGNMMFLWVFGDNVEDATGHLRFLIFYLACAAIAAYAHAMVDPGSEVPLVGASGAIAGVIGAYLLLHPKMKVWVLAFGRIPLRLSAFWVLGAWIAFQVVSFLTTTDSKVSWASHIGGFVAGAMLIVFFKRRGIALFDAKVPDVVMGMPEPTPTETAKNTPNRDFTWGRGK